MLRASIARALHTWDACGGDRQPADRDFIRVERSHARLDNLRVSPDGSSPDLRLFSPSPTSAARLRCRIPPMAHDSSQLPSISELDARFLQDLGPALLDTPTPAAALELLLRETCRYAEWDFAQAWRADRMEQRLDPDVCWMRDPKMQPYRDGSLAAETKFGIGVLWSAFLNRRAAICLDLAAEPTFRRIDSARKAGLRGGIFVPVMKGGDTLGALEFLMRQPRSSDTGRAGLAMRAAGRASSYMAPPA
ncbi:MAG: GAF domain-containing protein [Candidatus Brocadiae bacterium]|nr:GAF domain-containing protein [Candidatus Brocadiia bacterium]